MIFLGPSAGGAGATACQVINVASSSYCNNLASYPLHVADASAGGVINDIPIICGGRTSSGEVSACYAHNRTLDAWELFVDLAAARKRPASVVLNSGALWVTGGLNPISPYYLKSTELIFPNGTVKNGPDMPESRIAHCMTKMHDGRVMIIGTSSPSSLKNTVRIFDPSTSVWTNGPNLLFDRSSGACATFKSQLHGGRSVVMAAGGSGQATTEVYDYTIPGKSWEQSKTFIFL